MNCPNCKQPIAGNEKFCRKCGFQLKPAEPAADVVNESSPAGARTDLSGNMTGQPAAEAAQQPSYPKVTPPEVMPEVIPEVQPKKKSKLPLIIIISVVAAAVIGAGVFFAIWFFGGKDSGDKAAESSQEAASQTEVTAQAGQKNEEIAAVVERFEKALNDNDDQAMADQFVPELRDKKLSESTAFKYFADLVGQTGQTLTYKLELQDDVEVDGETASGIMKITVSVPLLGDQSTDANVSFKKVDGKWYISEMK